MRAFPCLSLWGKAFHRKRKPFWESVWILVSLIPSFLSGDNMSKFWTLLVLGVLFNIINANEINFKWNFCAFCLESSQIAEYLIGYFCRFIQTISEKFINFFCCDFLFLVSIILCLWCRIVFVSETIFAKTFLDNVCFELVTFVL